MIKNGADDAEIYLFMEICQRQNDKLDFSHLSKNVNRNLNQLLKNKPIRDALNRVLDIPGFREGMRLTTFHKILSMKCDEMKEVVSYLNYILAVWKKVLPGDPAAVKRLDPATVRTLELTCPKYSSADREKFESLMNSGEILHEFTDPEKKEIYGNLLSLSCIIPSLRSFFDDLNYLMPCAQNFRYAVGLFGRNKKTIAAALRDCFTPVEEEKYIVQVEDGNFEKTCASPAKQFELGQRQLWLFAMREFARVAPPVNHLKRSLATIKPERAESDILCDFATLALRLGFSNNHIKELRQRSPVRDIAREALLRARRPTNYEYNPDSFVSLLDQFENMADTAKPCAVPRITREMIWKDSIETSKRSGPPHAFEHMNDKKHLFFDVFMAVDPPITGVSSLFVRRCVFMAFLDCKQEDHQNNTSDEVDDHCPQDSRDHLVNESVDMRSDEVDRYRTKDSRDHSENESVGVRSSQLALVRRISTCTSDEINDRRVQKQRTGKRIEREIYNNSLSRSEPRLHKKPITFVSYESNEWRIVSQLPSDNPSAVIEAAATYMAHRLRPFSVSSSHMRPILPEKCYDAAISSIEQVVVLIPTDYAQITRDLRASALKLRFNMTNSEQNQILEDYYPDAPRSVSDRSSVYSSMTSSTMHK